MNPDNAAFPRTAHGSMTYTDLGSVGADPQHGLSKRELFAAMAMESWVVALSVRRGEAGYEDQGCAVEAARLAVFSADALLDELSK